MNNLHAPLNLYGFLATAQGAGAILGSILAGMFAQRIGLIRTLTSALLIAGVGLLVYSRLTSFVPALIVVVLMGIFVAGLNVAVGPLLLRVTPRAYVGRVTATLNPTSAIMQVVGTVLSGYLASDALLRLHAQLLGMTFGPIDTIFTGGAVVVLIGSIYSLFRLGFTDPQPFIEEAPESIATDPVALVVNE